MSEDVTKLIAGIIFTEFHEELGPNPVKWVPSDLAENLPILISIKTITLLSGEQLIPKSLVIIPFPSLNLKGLVKYIQWDDETRRGGIVQTAITLLFKEIDDLIFYKYMKDLEFLFDETAQKIIELEKSKADRDNIIEKLGNLQKSVSNILVELRDNELSAKESEAFPAVETKETTGLEYRYKIVVAGDPGVGKTSTVLRFTNNAFKRTYMPTIGVNITEKTIHINDLKVQLIIWDIAGQSKFEMMRTHFYQGAEGVLLIFDLTRFKTFNSIYNWYKDIKKNRTTTKPLIGFLLGNKNDLTDERDIKKDAAEQLADELNIEYIETSALTGENINMAFQKIAETLCKSEN